MSGGYFINEKQHFYPCFVFALFEITPNVGTFKCNEKTNDQKQTGKEDTGHLRICAVKLKKKNKFNIFKCV